MWTPLCISRWILLLSLGAVVLCSASAVSPVVQYPCCFGGVSKIKGQIQQCFEQKPGPVCSTHAFIVSTGQGEWQCVSPKSASLGRMMKTGQIRCPPLLGIFKRRFQVLDEDFEA